MRVTGKSKSWELPKRIWWVRNGGKKESEYEKEIDEKEGKSRKSDEKGIKEGKEVVKLKEKEQRKNEREKESKKEQNERERESKPEIEIMD